MEKKSSQSHWEEILNHPTSHVVKQAKDSKDYLTLQYQFLKSITEHKNIEELKIFGEKIKPKELASLHHQKDLLNAVLVNLNHKKELEKLGFDTFAYLRGSLDSDMGKLSAYKELFTSPSAKSDFLFRFLQAKTAHKSWITLRKIFKKYQMPDRPFLNPKVSPERLRTYFKSHPILLGYLHEFPGMIDAVIAYELEKITPLEFENQILVNLGHSGPSAGYWKYLETVLIPKNFGKDKTALQEMFKGTQYQIEKSKHLHPHYFKTTSFESFISTFYDRMSQATRGGYQKIDWEIHGDPIRSVNTLLLKDNPEGTRKQLNELLVQMKNCTNITHEKKIFFNELVQAGIRYLEKYQKNLNSHLSYSSKDGDSYLRLQWRDKDIKFYKKEGKYSISRAASYRAPASTQSFSEDEMRRRMHFYLIPLLTEMENDFGDPFKDDNWK